MAQTLFAPACCCEKVNSFASHKYLNLHAIENPYFPIEVNSLWRKRATEKGFWGKFTPNGAAKVNGYSPKTAPLLGFSGPCQQARECLEKAIGGARWT
ncbi:hypothetical protein MTBLM1_70060 [Rhodospirillaceae bacterium LM-1]|nr:hypothetical protein MTBLM1_70060 [Rhodospirillaceae bacterium LM-1]